MPEGIRRKVDFVIECNILHSGSYVAEQELHGVLGVDEASCNRQ